MTTESKKAFEEWFNSLSMTTMVAEKAWQASEQRILSMLESEEMVEKITELQANGWDYGTQPRDKAKAALKVITDSVR